ncbi:hypothetical protein LTS08_008476 [Lithohypha guttulata]|nr:hypothetical protein LTS08_008476 [Lithohypha guttulata]
MSRNAYIGSLAFLAVLIANLWQPIAHRATVLGLTRSPTKIDNIHGIGTPIRIPDTIHCEDVHYHRASNRLYTACEGPASSRTLWFPPLAHFSRRNDVGQGKIVVVNPTTFESTELVLSGFHGPLITHGIDIFPSEDGQMVTIFAVNHLPNPEYNAEGTKDASQHKARSQIEVFSHTIGSDTAVWVRSVRHPHIRTPNDIYATGPTSFYVTNDHYYREGSLRLVEDLLEYSTGAWSDVVHVDFSNHKADATSALTVSHGLIKSHNPNGLGHTTQDDELLLVDAAGGELYVMARNPASGASNELTLRSRIQLDSSIDNPSYYDDQYATSGMNASGYVLAGLLLAHQLGEAVTTNDSAIPTVVWYVRTTTEGKQEKSVIFQDDGKLLRSASAAVLVGIDPAGNDGKKQAWLFATGFVSEAMIAARIELST